MNPIRVTQNAWIKITDIINKSNNKFGFVYSASSGGCNGFNFELDLLEKDLYDKIIQNIVVVAKPPLAIGIVIRINTPNVEQPSTLAASSISIGTSSKNDLINHTTNDIFASV